MALLISRQPPPTSGLASESWIESPFSSSLQQVSVVLKDKRISTPGMETTLRLFSTLVIPGRGKSSSFGFIVLAPGANEKSPRGKIACGLFIAVQNVGDRRSSAVTEWIFTASWGHRQANSNVNSESRNLRIRLALIEPRARTSFHIVRPRVRANRDSPMAGWGGRSDLAAVSFSHNAPTSNFAHGHEAASRFTFRHSANLLCKRKKCVARMAGPVCSSLSSLLFLPLFLRFCKEFRWKNREAAQYEK